MFDRILVPLDGSEFAERALTYATSLARISSGAVTLLSVVHTTDGQVASPARPDESRGAIERAYLAEQAHALRRAGVPRVTTDLRFGDPARMIVEAAREARVQLIIMSTQGLGAKGRYALGSIASQVLSTAPCPVFMVRINKPEPPRSEAEERWQQEGGANVE